MAKRELATPVAVRDFTAVKLKSIKVIYQAITHTETVTDKDENGEDIERKIDRGPQQAFLLSADDLTGTMRTWLSNKIEQNLIDSHSE